MEVLVIVFWMLIVSLTMMEYGPYCKELGLGHKIIVGLVFLIGSPIFAAANILEIILNYFMPEGWGEDDE